MWIANWVSYIMIRCIYIYIEFFLFYTHYVNYSLKQRCHDRRGLRTSSMLRSRHLNLSRITIIEQLIRQLQRFYISMLTIWYVQIIYLDIKYIFNTWCVTMYDANESCLKMYEWHTLFFLELDSESGKPEHTRQPKGKFI